MARSVGLAILAIAIAALVSACGEGYSYSVMKGRLEAGSDARTSAAFAMNRRPLRLEAYLRLSEGASAAIVIDHPDGRTTDTLIVEGPGIRELMKEFQKEPGSWGLRLEARGGRISYWAAIHDKKKFAGPDEDERRQVEGD